ncbi:MAG: hypothetical protein PUK49_09520, partial [Oscillospiraceae bacterium]|nr:hypothetical protein [Oscillospiraceae bacterium]
VPELVSEELWDKCNEIFKERSAVVKSRERSLKDKSVFTGKIFCAADDKPYWRTSYSNSVSKGKPIYQWICSEKRRFGAKACASFSILESDLYEMLSGQFKDIAENIEDYVDTFLKIYREADTSSNMQKELDSLRARLAKEKAKREKLLDAYTEELITKAEFKERNDASNITISELEEDIFSIEKKAAESDDYVRELEKIEKYFKEMYSPDREMTREEVDEMVLTIIDRINVIPRNEECMKLEIKLKTGANRDVAYVRGRNINDCRSGHISKKMIDAYKMGNKA